VLRNAFRDDLTGQPSRRARGIRSSKRQLAGRLPPASV